MEGVCKLCGTDTELKESHLIPKFVGRWTKKTGITGFLRESNNIRRRAQDLAKEHLLCGECEALFSSWESEFSKKVFYPFVDKNESVATYQSWMSKFCASLSWRTLIYIRSKNDESKESEEYVSSLRNAETHLRRFLLGEQANLNEYEQHLFHLQAIESTSLENLPTNINRYFLRTISMDIVGNKDNLFIFTKLPSFILLGAINCKGLEKLRNSRIAINRGRLSPRQYRWPDGFIDYIFEKANKVSAAQEAIPKHQKDKIDAYIVDNPEKAAHSKLFEAILSDYDQFGKKIFKKSDSD